MLDQLALTRDVLAKRARDPRVKLLGLDVDLGAISSALDELEMRIMVLKAAFAAMSEEMGERRHPGTCECQACALARVVKLSRENPR